MRNDEKLNSHALREELTSLYPELCRSCGIVAININARVEDIQFGDISPDEGRALIEQDAKKVSRFCSYGPGVANGDPPYQTCQRGFAE